MVSKQMLNADKRSKGDAKSLEIKDPEEEGSGRLRLLAAVDVDDSPSLDRDEEEEWAVETSCYLCYAQCSNFGVHGKGGRPCAKGVSDIIKRRRKLRKARKENSEQELEAHKKTTF